MEEDIVPLDSRYIPFTQHRWCCVPACISMIMYRHKIPLIPQELLGYHLGLVVPADQKEYFWNVRISEQRPSAGYGTRIDLDEFNPNNAFKTLNIPLSLEKRLIDKFSSFEQFKNYLVDMEKEDRDIILCFDIGTLWDNGIHDGHTCLLDRVYGEEVRIIDPSWNSCNWKIVNLQKLYDSMQYHGRINMGGCWEVYS